MTQDDTLNVGYELCRRLKDFTARLEAGDDSLFRKLGDVSLRQDISRYLASLPPHVADRKAALLLREALTALDVADAIIAGAPEWTPVTERVPGPGGHVLVATRKGVTIAWLAIEDNGDMFWESPSPDGVYPTHWMPLPGFPS